MSTDTFLALMDIPQGIMVQLGILFVTIVFTRDIT